MHYRVRVKRGEVEIEVESSEREYVETKLEALLKDAAVSDPPVPRSADTGLGGQSEAKPLSLPEFMRMVGVTSGMDKVLSIVYYLEKHDGRSSVKTADIRAGLRTVRTTYANPSDAISRLKTRGLLMDGDETNAFMLSSSGEAEVEGWLAGGGTGTP